jgi:hypothetical protein
MKTMIDEMYDRHYQAGREALNGSIVALGRRLGEALGNTFKVLNRIEYSAPWSAEPTRTKCN